MDAGFSRQNGSSAVISVASAPRQWTGVLDLTRAFDIISATIIVLLFGPLLVVIAAAVWLVDPGPIFFAHHRIGRSGRVFPCYKFRSMVINSEEVLRSLLETDNIARLEWELNHKLIDDPRITKIGKFLRKSSLDELPQFFNVLRGDMSLVGPRPIVAAEAARYGRYFEEYCSVRPGITGLWQISGRSDTTYRRRVALDVVYSRMRSMRLNLRILAATPVVVLLGKGSR
jgi:exopolysaccharide production protein ExoY